MWSIGPIGFGAPWLLLGLIALPILWLLLRAVPPAPIRRRFPGVALLLGLTDDETQTDRTPWWLLLLRTLAVAAAIVGFAGPVLNPQDRTGGDGPLLVLMDGTWAGASDWTRRIERVDVVLGEALQAGRETAVVVLTDIQAGDLAFRSADAWSAELPNLEPAAWVPDADAVISWADGLGSGFDTYWVSDGLDHPWRAGLLSALQNAGAVSVFEAQRPVFGLRPARFQDGAIALEAVRSRTTGASEATVIGHGLDPSGTPRQLTSGTFVFGDGEKVASIALSLPPELRNRITR
ncbi:MAG: LytTR family transcriptional regulator, partial [Boseongicola sp.]|nr:LytTR family transcriptional regulator [Boseongicola sp.]